VPVPDTGWVRWLVVSWCWFASAFFRGSWPACRRVVMCWAVVGALGLGYLFASSTVPVTTTGDPGLFGPAGLQVVAVAAAFVLGLPSFFLPVVWLPMGVRYLGQTRYHRRRSAWIAGTAAAVVLEAVVIVGVGIPAIAPNYVGAPIVSWVQLAECAAFLVIGVALAAILPARPQQASVTGADPL
jgi:hypothetical protein